LSARDVRVSLDGERLRLSAPRGALTPELQREVARRKEDILAYLRRAAASEAPPALVCLPREGGLPLSFAQERLWFLHRLDPESVAYNLQANLQLAGALDRRALQAALTELVRRHELLRTRFEARDGLPVQSIDPPPEAVALPVADLAPLPLANRGSEAQHRATLELRRPFDLERGHAIRFLLLRFSAEEHQLLVTQHHIVTDGWSIALLVEEVLGLYEAAKAGTPPPSAAPVLQYADFAAWQPGLPSTSRFPRRCARRCRRWAGGRASLPS
jgi:nonribosomal peptide synthetase protein BlmVII